MNYVNDIEAQIDRRELLQILKIRKNDEKNIPAQLGNIIAGESEKAQSLLRIKAVWSLRKVIGLSAEGIDIEGGISFVEKTFKNFMSEISHICFALVTIGPELEKRCAELQSEGEYTRALVLDAAGSSAVEDAACKLNHIIAKECGLEGVEFSKRFSPGYGNFTLSEQKKLAELLPFEKLGVKLTNSYMMIPQKSITFCIYAGKIKEKIPGSCEICNQKDCSYRK